LARRHERLVDLSVAQGLGLSCLRQVPDASQFRRTAAADLVLCPYHARGTDREATHENRATGGGDPLAARNVGVLAERLDQRLHRRPAIASARLQAAQQ